MSQETRRRKKVSFPSSPNLSRKTSTVPLSDGWTLVTRSPHHMRSEVQSSSSATLDISGADLEAQIQRARNRVERCRKLWVESNAARQVEQLFRREVGSNRVVCERALVVGLGRLNGDGESRTAWQLTVFLEVLRLLELCKMLHQEEEADQDEQGSDLSIPSTSNLTIQIYARDPIFTPLDIGILKTFNITVLEKQESTEDFIITASTFLFAPFLTWEILLPDILAGLNPCLFIGNDIDVMIETLSLLRFQNRDTASDNVSPEIVKRSLDIAENFIKGRRKTMFPKFDSSGLALSGMAIYFQDSSTP